MARVAWNKGKTLSQSHKDKIRASVLARPNRKHTQESKDKIGTALSIKWTPEMIEAVQECQRQGMGFNKMADYIGVSAGAIWRASKVGTFDRGNA
jgi:predicted DNA-binding protein (UPF0251 family)